MTKKGKIDSVIFGEIKIDGKDYYSDVIVWWDGHVKLIAKNHILNINALGKVIKRNPDIIIIGTGLRGMVKIDPEVKMVCENSKVTLYSDPTKKAIEMYNGMIARQKRVAGIFHITS